MNGFGKHKGKKQLLWYSTQSLRRRTQEQALAKWAKARDFCVGELETRSNPPCMPPFFCLATVVIFKGHHTGNRKVCFLLHFERIYEKIYLDQLWLPRSGNYVFSFMKGIVIEAFFARCARKSWAL